MVGGSGRAGGRRVLSRLELQLSRRAERDLRQLSRQDRGRVIAGLDRLAAGAGSLDVKPLAGTSGWLRLRVGDHRVLYRPLSEAEAADPGGYLIDRVVHRRDLELAVRQL